MARLIIVTAGTSLLENLDRLEYPGLRERLEKKLPRYAENVLTSTIEGAEWKGEPGPDSMTTGALWALDRYARRAPIPEDDEERRKRPQTAEISSLARMNVSAEDHIVFLCSDTGAGAFSAVVNAYLLTLNGDPPVLWDGPFTIERGFSWNWQPTYVHRELMNLQVQNVAVMRIPGLDPERKQLFEQQGVSNLIDTIARLVIAAKGSDMTPVINFTGGFKAAIPLITQAAAWLGGIAMWGLYQGATEAVEVPVLAARVAPHYRRLVLALAMNDCRVRTFVEEKAREHGWDRTQLTQLAHLDRSSRSSANVLRSTERPLFVDSAGGDGVELSLLGKTLLAVILARIGSIYASEELNELRPSDDA